MFVIDEERLNKIWKANTLAILAGTDVTLSFDDVSDLLRTIKDFKIEYERSSKALAIYANKNNWVTYSLFDYSKHLEHDVWVAENSGHALAARALDRSDTP